jgi:hypothetical protein
MSPRLTLLLLCESGEPYSVFISALMAAGFDVLVARTAGQATKFLSRTAVDVIMILRDDPGRDKGLGCELKRMAPAAQVLWLGRSGQQSQPSGIDALCNADVGDEVVARAVAVFFRQWLPPAAVSAAKNGQAKTREVSLAGVGPAPAA